MQNDFILANGKLPVAGATSIVEPANIFLRTAKFDKTIATFDTHIKSEYETSDEGKQFPLHCEYGTTGWQLGIKIPKYTRVLKPVFDVWVNDADMKKAISGFAPNDTRVFLFGVASDFCVRQAIAGYLIRGYNVSVIADLCMGIVKQIDQVASEFNSKKLQIITTKGFYNEK